MSGDTFAALSRIVRDELGTDPGPIAAGTVLDDLPGWDSVSLAGVLLAIEAEFGVAFGRDSIDQMRTGADLARLVEMGATGG